MAVEGLNLEKIASGIYNIYKDSRSDILKLLGLAKDEYNQFLNNGMCSYLDTVAQRYRNADTFLFDSSVPFEKCYYPLTVKANGKKNIKIEGEIDSLYKDTNFVSISGRAGSGKTMILRYCFLSSLGEDTERIPIVIELRRIDRENITFEEYIMKKIFRTDLAKNKSIYQRLVQSGLFHFMLDGYDEIGNDQLENRKKEIEEFVEKYPKNYYLVTARDGSFDIHGFENYAVCNLTEKEIPCFIDKQVDLMEGDNELFRMKIKEVIKDNPQKGFHDYMSNPLLLSMFLKTYGNHPEIPSKMCDFYSSVFDTLYSGHDTKKEKGWMHATDSKLKKEQFLTILKSFSYKTYMSKDDGKNLFNKSLIEKLFKKIFEVYKIDANVDDVLNDYCVAINILIKDGLDYAFPHRSMQEYFAALFITSQPEDVRKKIYEELSNVTGIGETNIWDLCRELDELFFCKHFILPSLEQSIQIIDPLNNDLLSDENAMLSFNTFAKENSIKVGVDEYGFYSIGYTGIFDQERMLRYLGRFKATITSQLLRMTYNKELHDAITSRCEISKEKVGTYKGYLLYTQDTQLLQLYKKHGIIDAYRKHCQALEDELNKCKKRIAELEKQSSILTEIWNNLSNINKT